VAPSKATTGDYDFFTTKSLREGTKNTKTKTTKVASRHVTMDTKACDARGARFSQTAFVNFVMPELRGFKGFVTFVSAKPSW